MTETTTARLHGQDAVDHARETGAKLSAYTDPLEDARAGFAWDSDAVIERLRVDPDLVYIDVPCPMCAAADVPISDDELASAEAAGTICGQCAEVVAENREALACS